jgi:uncharacterized membrane protein
VSQQDEQPVRVRSDAEQAAADADNSLGRLLTLSDGIFAIAMTLLALDLKVPDLTGHVTDSTLRHQLAMNSDSYWSFLLTFFVIASYWRRHRVLMKSVVTSHPALIRDTLILLAVVAVMPFPASLLGRYGGEAISLSLYGAVNALANASLILIATDVRRLRLTEPNQSSKDDLSHRWTTWFSLLVFLLCIPAGYVVGKSGLFVLVLLAVPDLFARIRWMSRRMRRRAAVG